jgi:hypothetical protein
MLPDAAAICGDMGLRPAEEAPADKHVGASWQVVPT